MFSRWSIPPPAPSSTPSGPLFASGSAPGSSLAGRSTESRCPAGGRGSTARSAAACARGRARCSSAARAPAPSRSRRPGPARPCAAPSRSWCSTRPGRACLTRGSSPRTGARRSGPCGRAAARCGRRWTSRCGRARSGWRWCSSRPTRRPGWAPAWSAWRRTGARACSSRSGRVAPPRGPRPTGWVCRRGWCAGSTDRSGRCPIRSEWR